MNLNKEIKTSQLLTGLGACIVLGIVLAYLLAPHFRKTIEVDDTLTLERQQTRTEIVNPPPQNLKRTPTDGEDKDVCAQVITHAKNPVTGETANFPTPCDLPEGWEPVPPR